MEMGEARSKEQEISTSIKRISDPVKQIPSSTNSYETFIST